MASEWIKWTKGLAKKPEVFAMAKRLGRSRHEVAGLLCEFWEWADDNLTVEENQNAEQAYFGSGSVRIPSALQADDRPHANCLQEIATSFVDSISGVSGFSDSMIAVGWLIIRSGSLEFPNFARHNGKSSKRRALDALRNSRNRNNQPPDEAKPPAENVSDPSACEADEMRTREEESISSFSETKKKPPNRKAWKSDPDFCQFINNYPRRQKIAEAFSLWRELGLDQKTITDIIAAVALFKQSENWKKDRGMYVPLAVNFLMDEQWKSPPGSAERKKESPDERRARIAEERRQEAERIRIIKMERTAAQ